MQDSFDMPVAELLTYTGITPRPDDFDAFWEAGLRAMRSLDARVELVSAEFQTALADCFHLWFTGVGGARIHAKLIRPKNQATPGPALLQFHGYSSSSGDWTDKLAYVAAGFTVVALDCRGQGGLSEDVGGVKGWTLNGQIVRGLEDKPEKLYFRQVFLDTAQLADIVISMPFVDENRVGAMGISQGGGLTLACAALEPRIRMAAPIYPFLCDYQRAYQLYVKPSAYQEIIEWFQRRDPRHERVAEVFYQLGYIDVQHLAGRISAETLMLTGLRDTICPPSTQFAAYNKIRAPKRHIFYPDFAHDRLPGQSDILFQFFSQL